MSGTGYEFTQDQNTTMDRLAGRMRWVGRLLMFVAVLSAAESGLLLWKGSGGALGLEVGAVLLLIGLWSTRAGGEFARITRTQGADISHLMQGLRELRKLYDLQFWAFVVLAILLAVALLSTAAGPGRLTGPYP